MRRKHRPSQERTLKTEPVPRDLEDRTAVLIASGPSLTKAQVHDIKYAWCDHPLWVMGVNDTYRIAPWIDTLYACDPQWWDVHIDAVRKCYIDELVTQDRGAAERYGLWHINSMSTNADPKRALSNDSGYIHTGSHSGYQLLNIAYLRGAKKIILVGYDCTMMNGKRHWFGNHPEGLNRNSNYGPWVAHYRRAATQLENHGIEVINCSPGSAIDCFPKMPLSRALP